MKCKKMVLVLFVFVTSLPLGPPVKAQQQQFSIAKSVFGSGGEASSSSSLRLVGTLGQPVIGVVSSPSHVNEVGFWYQTIDLITSVEELSSEAVPREFRLEQNYPNPFNPTTTIGFSVPKHSRVTLTIYDLLGRLMAILVDEDLNPGEYKVSFNASGLPSGVYVVRMQAQSSLMGSGRAFVQSRKLMLLK